MDQETQSTHRKRLGRWVLIGVVIAAVLTLLLTVYQVDRHPRTDDANVWANYIEIAPEVSGRLVQLPVKDNAFVKKGDLLFVIDPRPYEYALQQALADQDLLEQQIIDEARKIAAQNSSVDAATAAVHVSKTGIQTASSSIDLAKAAVTRAQAASAAAEARLKYATNDLNRIQPLLQKQYVTVDQVDQANTAVRVAQGNYDESQAALAQSQAALNQAVLQHEQAGNTAVESQARLGQAIHTVDRVETLIAQRPAKASRVDSARLDLERTRVLAPFDAYVTSMNISEGAYARPGSPLFTLIDSRNWYVIANYRESKLKNIRIGSPVDVYVMAHPDHRFEGHVESIGYGIFPEDGKQADGLPNIERTLNWVHLSARFPVRVHIDNPDPSLFRIGATAVTVVR
ncbi:biotin/lipoyl-binding protein [Granulicella mallensis]|uniref:Multidrug efflux system membrane fusion protein n=1 Tax=Granulicella mallensis TaxID=940614 RepID=A0A7W7ZR28_9BACT|nr:biotin/lipoyl-binding protein [Granulicella mallensis]MBB5064508.1 multidrug efflux system membrane fusion protein [Granulicella mallensis]